MLAVASSDSFAGSTYQMIGKCQVTDGSVTPTVIFP